MEMLKLVFVLCIVQVCTASLSIYHDSASHRDKRDAEINSNDYCNDQSVNELQPDQVIGNCSTFGNYSCLCVLNDKCDYDATTNICFETHDCSKYNENPVACKENACFYNCADKTCTWNEVTTCSSSGDPQPPTATTKPNDYLCSENCFDICKCRATGCDYNLVTGTCSAFGDIACADSAFAVNECGRENAIYYKGGFYCNNTKARGICTQEKVISAVNLNGENFLDSRGIQHVAGRTRKFRDDHKIIKYFLSEVKIETDNNDQSLYTGGIYADPWKREPNRCITYYVSLCEEGAYEISIKATEKPNVFETEKLFNIKFAEYTIFPEVDIRRFESRENRAVELVLNFRIKNKVLLIAGHDPIALTTKIVPLSFCYGLCIFFEGSFRINAFSIIKFSNAVSPPQSASKQCRKYKTEWDCLAAKCYYKVSNSTCLPHSKDGTLCDESKPTQVCGKFEMDGDLILPSLPPGESHNCPRDNCNTRIQMLFTFDITRSVNPREYVARKFVNSFNKITLMMLKLTPHLQFGLTYTGEWPKNCFINQGAGQHEIEEGCHIRVVPFTDDLDKIRIEAENVWEMEAPPKADEVESILPAMAFAAADNSLGWERKDVDSNGLRVHRIIVFNADVDSLFKLDFPGQRGEFRGDGTDTCFTSKPPADHSVYTKVFTKYGIHAIGLIKDRFRDTYRNHFNKIKTPFCDVGYEEFGRIGSCAKTLLPCKCY